MFSRDGTRLAVGGGSWYGDGGLFLLNLSSGQTELFPCVDLPSAGGPLGPFTVSGICFAPDDRHLAASTWSSSHSHGPTLLFEVSGLGVAHRVTLGHRSRDHFGGGCPTGVLFAGGYTITRNYRADVRDVVAVWKSPRRLNVSRDSAPHHLTSSRLVVVRESVITGERVGAGLVSVPLGADPREVQVIPMQDCHVTAIGARPSGDGFVTGGRSGELDAWSWQGRWVQRRLRAATKRRAVHRRGLDIIWETYTPNSIVGVCSLPDGNRWASVSAGGEVCLWDADKLTSSWQIPEPGSPRSLAAHPDRPWLAIGIKKGGFGRPQSAVVLAEVNRVALDPAWRTPTVLALARAAGEERGSPIGPLDPVRLAVLADALEDAGCPEAGTLAHLRSHDRRLHDCWVLDGLLEKG
jgi:hypothetical protein